MSMFIKILSDGDCRVVRESPVAVGEVNRRVLVADIDADLGLMTCVWSRGVDDAEGRVREQVGEEKIRGNGRHGTSKRDVIRDGRHTQHLTQS